MATLAAPAPAQVTAAQRRTAMTLLLLAYISSYLDRSILNILVEPIKQDLKLSDTQLGFLSGTAFAIFYATLGIPVASLADRSKRKRIIAIALAVWSAMTAVCGLAQNFWQLALARIGVGIGEAGSSPPSHSIIADLYPREQRARAMAVYSLGVYLGGGLGTVMGGFVAYNYGWRAAFYVAGLPGLLLAVVIMLFLIEPQRAASPVARAPAGSEGALDRIKQLWGGPAARHLWRSRAARHLIAGVTVSSFVGYGAAAWLPAFLIRSYGLRLDTASAIIGPLGTLAGAAGVLGGGWLADRLARSDLRWTAWVIAVAKLCAFPFAALLYLSSTIEWAVVGLTGSLFFGAFYLGPTYAMIQSLTPVHLRSTAAAFVLFVLNLIGLGLGPQLYGVASDLLQPALGKESLRYTLLTGSVLTMLAGFFYYRAGIHYARELRVFEDRPGVPAGSAA